MRRKQQPINKNNQNENMNRKPHYYTVREKVLVRNKKRKILGSAQIPLSYNQGMKKWNCYHMSCLCDRLPNYYMD